MCSRWWGIPGVGYLERGENRPRLIVIDGCANGGQKLSHIILGMGVSRFKPQSSRARCILCVEVEDLCSNLVPLVLLTSHDRATSARRSVAHARGAAHDTSAAAQGVERCAARAHLLQGPAVLDHVMHRAPRPLNHQLPWQGSPSVVVGRVGVWGEDWQKVHLARVWHLATSSSRPLSPTPHCLPPYKNDYHPGS